MHVCIALLYMTSRAELAFSMFMSTCEWILWQMHAAWV